VADFLCALSVVGHSAVSFTDLRIILSVCRSRGARRRFTSRDVKAVVKRRAFAINHPCPPPPIARYYALGAARRESPGCSRLPFALWPVAKREAAGPRARVAA